jgi:hypothetical protein
MAARNSRGGARPGAGRPPHKLRVLPTRDEKISFVRHERPRGVAAAMSAGREGLLPYMHERRRQGGLKEERRVAASKASRGRFAPPRPPRLVVVKSVNDREEHECRP